MQPTRPTVQWAGWWWWAWLCILCSPPEACSYKTFIMEEYCEQLIDLQDRGLHAAHVRLTDGDRYRPHMSCQMSVRAPPGQRLTVAIETLDIAAGRVPCADYLSLLEGELDDNDRKPVAGVAKKLCGTQAPAPLASSGRAVTLKFDSNKMETGQGFTALITPFHEGNCSREEFKCKNGRCIDRQLLCDDHDNCGDGSDSCWLSVDAVVVIVIVTIVVFGVIVVMVLIGLFKNELLRKCWCRRCTAKNRKNNKPSDPDGVYQPTTEPVLALTDQAEAHVQV